MLNRQSKANDSTELLSKKRDRPKNDNEKEDRELLDLDNIRKVVSPPFSLRSFNEEEYNNYCIKHNNNKDNIENIKSNLQNEYSKNNKSDRIVTPKPKKNEEYTYPIPQKESRYLLRKRLLHQLSQSIDAIMSSHNCNEIESNDYFQLRSKDQCRERYCLKCIQEYSALDQSNTLMHVDNE